MNQAQATGDRAARKQRMPGQRTATVALAAAGIAALAGCTTPFSHASGAVTTPRAMASTAATATPSPTPAASSTSTAAGQQKVTTTATTTTRTGPACPGQEGWSLRAAASLKALYADTGALAADASADNAPAILKAGRKLAADALAAATLPLPPADPSSWRVLTAAYAAAGTALAGGDTSGAVPELEAGNDAISTFSGAVAKCLTATTLSTSP